MAYKTYKKNEQEPLTPMQAYNQALRFLGPRFLSCQELRQKLQRKHVEASIIDDIENKLLELDYLNDERLAEQVLRLYMTEAKYGVAYIRNKMRLRGLPVPSKISEYDEVSVALEITNKKFSDVFNRAEYSELADCFEEELSIDRQATLQKVIRFLKNRGFSTNTITIVLDELKIQN